MGLLKRVFMVLVVFSCIGGGQTFAYEAQLRPFSDLQVGDWAESAIYRLTSTGIVSGYPDGSFRADDPLTREAFIKMLMSLNSQEEYALTGSASIPIEDVEATTRWSYPYIEKAYNLDLLDSMIENGMFLPESPILREEVAVLAGRYMMQWIAIDEAQAWLMTGWEEQEQRQGFVDKEVISNDLRPYVYYSSYLGIMQGDDTGSFRPQSSLTRKEAAAVIERIIHALTKERTLSVIGFYAINSYKNIDKMDHLNEVMFGWSNLEYDQEGTARLNVESSEYRIPMGWESVIDHANEQKIIKHLMVFANNTGLKVGRFLQDQAARQAFIDSLHEALTDEGYTFDGVTIDFEGLMDTADREVYVSFLQEVKERIGEKSLSVAVPPINYYKGYDLYEIGMIADQVIVMAYDYTHEQSNLPSAPLPLVGETLETILQYIPQEKVVLGISKQANQWIYRGDGTSALLSPAIERVEQRIQQDDSTVEYAMPYFLTRILFQEDDYTSEIWYEDARSIVEKIRLAKYYGLRGVSLWHMGNFTADDWDTIKYETSSQMSGVSIP